MNGFGNADMQDDDMTSTAGTRPSFVTNTMATSTASGRS